jgi:alkyl hydroperoxide reductase subunit AhpC
VCTTELGYMAKIGDTDLNVAKLYNMLPAEEPGTSDGRTAATNATVRSVFIIGPDRRIKLMLTYPMSTGRNFDEIVRVLDSLQLTARENVATPVNWKPGEDVIIPTSGSDDAAKQKYPQGFKNAQAVPADRFAGEVRPRCASLTMPRTVRMRITKDSPPPA